jgi:hypothetical protein
MVLNSRDINGETYNKVERVKISKQATVDAKQPRFKFEKSGPIEGQGAEVVPAAYNRPTTFFNQNTLNT